MKHSRKFGFTLVELLLYIVIFGSLLIAVSLFFATASDSRVKNQSISEANQQGEAAIEKISQILRNASTISSPAAGSSAASLTVTVPTAGDSPTVINLSGTTLQIKEGAATAVSITNSKVQVTSLSFTNLSYASTPGIVRVEFTISRINTSSRNQYDYSKTFVTSAALRWP